MTDGPPTAGEPAWLPDPTGRHEYRWFDGSTFTDRVSDAGVVTIDAGDPAATAPPAWAPAPAWQAPTTASSPAPAAATTPPAGRSRRGLVLGLGALGVAAVAGGGFLVLASGGDDDGTGTIEGRLDGETPVAVHEVELAAGSALTVELAPDGDLDAVIAFVVDDDAADALEDTYDGVVALEPRELDEVFGVDDEDLGFDGDQVLLRTDLGFPGETERLLLATPVDLVVGVVVGPFEPDTDEGPYVLTLEAFSLDVGDEPDGDDLLEAIEDDDLVPDDFKQLADELRVEG